MIGGPRTPDVLSLALCVGHTGLDALGDDVPFELGHGGDDLEDELAGGGGGVEVVLVGYEIDPQGVELMEGVDQPLRFILHLLRAIGIELTLPA